VGLFGFEGDNAREKVIVLLTMCFALAMAMLDNTVVNVALPTLSRELGAGISSAAPTPWIARKAMSWPLEFDRPHSSDAAENTARPVRNIFLRQ
jgi:hypothetical protein